DDDKNDDGLDKLNDTIINRNINQNNLINNNHNIKPVLNPNNVNDVIGSIEFSDITQVEHACEQAHLNYENWAVNSNQKRAEILLKAAEMFEEVEYQNHLINLLMREAGKTLKNSIAEIREAVDFLRYYAKQILDYQSQIHNMQPLGVVTCISPWNFPLAIFIGQISAALVCGNSVIAKPAEQTSLIAGFAVDIMHKAGVPTYALQLLIGLGETIGDAMVKNPHVQAVIFTGSLNVAKIIQSNLSSRLNQHGQPIVLIAETGGQNAMIVDSSALPQQVVQDIIQSSFDSAGQRCSALRVLCIQEDIYEHTTELIQQAMEELNIGNSININCDVNAVIDRESLLNIQTYIKTLKSSHIIYQPNSNSQKQSSISNNGYFCPPTLIYINSLDVLQNEVFGPVLHIMKYKREDLAELVNNINHLGYGLTMGVHSRIEDSIQTVLKNSHVGNVYVNRNMVGAIVGVQPFGGDNLSGTGPKAGGGLYLLKLLQNKQECNYIIYKYLKQMQEDEDNSIRLESVTGEVNEYSLSIKKHILCIADKALDLKKQIDLVFNMGVSPIILEVHKNRIHGISDVDSKLITTAHNIEKIQNLDAILYAGKDSISIMQIIAKSYQKIIPIITLNEDNSYSLVSLFNEKSVSINTTAAGGNASLMSL
ncbi:MAG: transcriptional regulator, partial [Pseudomonadota bacterium]